MPNILDNLRKSTVASFIFPDAETLEVDGAEDTDALAESARGEADDEQNFENPQNPVDYATVQAEKIIETAKLQAEELKAERLQQAESEIEAACQQAKAEGFQQGYAEGLEQARAEAKNRLEEQLQKQTQEVAAYLKKVDNAREDMINQTKKELCDLSITVAEKVIRVSLKSSSEIIARMIQAATEKMKRQEWVHIYVGGYEAAALAQLTPELTVALASISDHIKIIPMADDETGTCIIETPNEIIDASVSTQVQNIREMLIGN